MSAKRSPSTVSKRRTHNRYSFSTRMKRSAQPLPSGSRTNAGELVRPTKRVSVWKWWLTYWDPARDACGVITKDPDQEIQARIDLVFTTFLQMRTATAARPGRGRGRARQECHGVLDPVEERRTEQEKGDVAAVERLALAERLRPKEYAASSAASASATPGPAP